MTILICTGFYIYVIFSVNVYREEILLRQKEGCVIKGKVKARNRSTTTPLSKLKKS